MCVWYAYIDVFNCLTKRVQKPLRCCHTNSITRCAFRDLKTLTNAIQPVISFILIYRIVLFVHVLLYELFCSAYTIRLILNVFGKREWKPYSQGPSVYCSLGCRRPKMLLLLLLMCIYTSICLIRVFSNFNSLANELHILYFLFYCEILFFFFELQMMSDKRICEKYIKPSMLYSTWNGYAMQPVGELIWTEEIMILVWNWFMSWKQNYLKCFFYEV